MALPDPELFDVMTALPSRRAFLNRAQAVLADPAAAPAALIIANIDHCKRFNDCHGHVVGDALIGAVASLWRNLARPGDEFARIGGDSFALLAPRTPPSVAAGLAETARARVAETFAPTGKDPRAARISVGVAVAHGHDLGALMAAAEEALYAAKRGGRDRVALAPAA